ncbi:MAG: sigma-70 family RNA polymerase sigma factor [Kiritimatiellae bacterium]|jgi:RNA polymerase sigma-70 factor (ECF subfamily)|nr:sigma-70 family RNA polymerase sigma factor [Kiritimatiellia bacterium]
MELVIKEQHLIVSQALAGAQDKLYAMIYVLMAGSFDTMDVLQETNVAILKHADSYDESRPALPWFKAFAMNQVLYYRRVRRDEKLLFDTDMINDLAAILDEYEDQTENSEADYVDLLEKCLEKLPPWQRDLLKERYQDGAKVNKMAATRLMSRVSLSVLMFRIRKVLQSCIEKAVKKGDSVVSGENIENDFVRELEAVLDGTATHLEQAKLFDEMRRTPDLKRVYVAHARLHAILHCRNNRFFSKLSASSNNASVESFSVSYQRFRYPVAAAISAILLLGGLLMWRSDRGGLFSSEYDIHVRVCDIDQDEWLHQITPLDLQAYEENMGFHKFQESEPEMIKYEPGVISNPGAGIEIIAMEGKAIQGRHLVKGDKVWREHIVLPAEGSMKFKLESGATVTLIGPAELDIKDERTLSLQSGAVMLACVDQPVILKLPDAELHNCNAVVCVDHSARKKCDVLTLSGVVKMIYSEDDSVCYLSDGDGIRLVHRDEPVHFQCIASNQDAEEKFLSGKSKIVMKKRRL